MLLSLAAALGAAIAFGVAAVLQAIGTSRASAPTGADPRLLLLLLRQPMFLGALALDGGGFALHVLALRSLPLFLVQSVVASSVAVTALVAARVFRAALTPAQWGAIAGVCAGLAVLGTSAESLTGTATGTPLRLGLLAGVLATAVAGPAATRLPGRAGAVVLGLVGGVDFGIVAVCARVLPGTVGALLTDLASYVLLLAGLLAFLLYSLAMQRGSVTTTTAALVITQTGIPAVLGVALLGDRVRPGWAVPAVLGFVVALAGTALLSRLDRVSA